jgi:NAD(P)-dependent dehydrogenase (short-subunit alcohol dehydrogenase family)
MSGTTPAPEKPAARAQYDFTGRVAIVTGAAQGIGEAYARALAAAGAAVVVADIDAGAGQAVAQSIAADGGRCAFAGTDVYASFYGLAKVGINGLTQQLAHELGGMGIRVNAIAPGPTDTAATRTVVGGMTDDIVKSLALKRMGQPQDLVGACLFLLSDDAGWITGQIFNVDGGQVFRS